MRSPVLAMLWENWRLTRVEAAWKLALGIVGGLVALVVFDALAPSGNVRHGGAVIALILIVFRNITGWVSIPKINGKRPCFPFDGASVWGSLSFIALGNGYEPLRSWQRAIEGTLGALTGDQQIALVVVLFIGFTAVGASHASLWALWVRYFRRMNIAISLLALYGLALSLLALAVRRGIGSALVLDAMLNATTWMAAVAIVFATIYLFWTVCAERLLTVRQAGGAVLVSAAFGAACATVLQAGGVPLSEMSVTNTVWTLLLVLLPLTASALAPWSLSRIRHT